MTAEAHARADEDARRRALDPATSFIVQAPAGSGKTELLIQRYLRLLATVDFPEEILAITFTNKAAAEMRLRVVDALDRAISGNWPDAAHERLTHSLAESVLEKDRELDWGIAQNSSRLRIQTIDSLNAQISSMQPLTTSAGTTGNVIPGDAELEALYIEAAGATLDYLAADAPFREAAAEVLSHLDNDSGLYLAYLSDMLKSRDQWLPLIGAGSADAGAAERARRILEATLKDIVRGGIGEFLERLPEDCRKDLLELAQYAGSNLEMEKGDTDAGALSKLDTLPPDVDAGSWKTIARCLLKDDGGVYRKLDKRQGFPSVTEQHKARKRQYSELMDRLVAVPGCVEALHVIGSLPTASYSDAQWSVLTALLDLLRLASAELRQLFRQRGVVDYIEVALNADAALGTPEAPGDVALLLDYRLRHILVDEMQDTSIAQYRVLESLTAGWESGDGRSLFCVGDPMQSIYRFRNAEVSQFLLAREEGIGGLKLESLLLEKNFRSGSGLVDWFNASFPGILASTDDPDVGAVSYATAVAADHLRGFGTLDVHPVLGTDEAAEAATTLNLIKESLRFPADESVAVLVRSRGQLRKLIPLLRDENIPFRAIDIDRLTDLPEIIDLLALTRAIVHRGDRHAWLAVLRAPWIGLSWADLHALARNDRSSSIATLLNDRERLASLSVSGRQLLDIARPVLQSMLGSSRCQSLRSRVERAWLELGGPAAAAGADEVANVHRYLDVLAGLERAGGLADVAALEEQLDRERVSNVSDARLQILTMHKSKGLQFDHVILHGLGRRPQSDKARVLHWMDSPARHGEERRLLAPVGRRDEVEKDPIHSFIADLDRRKAGFEKQRLLYVACTRARRSLHLVGHAEIDPKSDTVRKPVSSSLLSLLWPAVHEDYENGLERGAPVHMPDRDVEWLHPSCRRIDAARRMIPADPPPVRVDLPPRRDDEVEFDWAGSNAKLAGTLVHHWLQRGAGDLRAIDTGQADSRELYARRWLAERGVTGADAGQVLSRVEEALAGVRGDSRGEWLLEGEGHAELAITGIVDGRVETRIIDRVRIDGDKHWVVDYKTSVHEGGNLERFLAEERRRYAEQLRACAILYEAWSGVKPKAALYFPMLGAFVEA